MPEPADLDRLLVEVYDELRRLAAGAMRDQRGITLQPTALVHEVYVKLASTAGEVPVDRPHLLATAAKVMRQILVDRARAAHSEKRGGAAFRVTLSRADAVDPEAFDLLAFDDVLHRLETKDERQARIVELRYIVGLSVEETAEALELSPRTVKREAAMAKAWLFKELRPHTR